MGGLTPVLHADNGADGLQIMARHPGAWVLLDSSLEDDAWQTLAQLRRAWPQARCLVVVHRAAHAQKATALGAHGTIPGDCSLEQLEAALQTLHADPSS
jgi:DNA-binding NarL/FixJ family response regulator